jgi:positive regulator of sigma E activity
MDWQHTMVIVTILLAAGVVVRAVIRRHNGCASCASAAGCTPCAQGTCGGKNHGTTPFSSLKSLERQQ